MKVLVIVAHPNRASFSHAIALTCSKTLSDNSHEVIAYDLNDEHFDPILPFGEFPRDAALPPELQLHCDDVSQADGIVIVHPNWWGQPPAILKGWVDRVIRPAWHTSFWKETRVKAFHEVSSRPIALLRIITDARPKRAG
jgi:NAD(P)H dehydrogenase (quinone)